MPKFIYTLHVDAPTAEDASEVMISLVEGSAVPEGINYHVSILDSTPFGE